MFWLNKFPWQWITQVAHIPVFWICPVLSNSFIQCHIFVCLAKPITWKENADIWMERPAGLGNSRGILQIFFLSGLDNWEPIVGQQLEVVKSECLNGMSLWLRAWSSAMQTALLFPACSEDRRQLWEKAEPLREKRNSTCPGVSANDHCLKTDGSVE